MSCSHLSTLAAGLEQAFTIDAARVTFGRGALAEIGDRTRALGATRVAPVTDRQLRALPWFAEVDAALRAAGLVDEVAIEPTDASPDLAVRFAGAAGADAYVSLGGGSVIDTCEVANLLARSRRRCSTMSTRRSAAACQFPGRWPRTSRARPRRVPAAR